MAKIPKCIFLELLEEPDGGGSLEGFGLPLHLPVQPLNRFIGWDDLDEFSDGYDRP